MKTIILDRLKTWYDRQLLDNQHGFRSGRGTADGIFITKSIQQISDSMQNPVYILFVDLSAAFDHVVRHVAVQVSISKVPRRYNSHQNTRDTLRISNNSTI